MTKALEALYLQPLTIYFLFGLRVFYLEYRATFYAIFQTWYQRKKEIGDANDCA